jgi:uncharacterized protein YheU (UPF0270 family)
MEDEYSQLPPEESRKTPERPPATEAEDGVEVPFRQIAPETLERLIEAFVLREGTDYGALEARLERKIADVRSQLESGEAHIVFDLTTETCSIVGRPPGHRK